MPTGVVVTGLEMCTVAGATADATIKNMLVTEGYTSSATSNWTEIKDKSFKTGEDVYNNLQKLAISALKSAKLVENNQLTKVFKDSKKCLVCGSNFLETNIWEENHRDKSVLRRANRSMYRLLKDLDINGGLMNVSTACSSGASAIVTACQLIEDDIADIVIIGGYDVKTLIPYWGMKVIGALSKQQIQPFDKNRSGTDLADGIGFMVLESYEHAVARGAKIFSKIMGYGVTADGYNITAPDPSGIAQERAIRLALKQARIEPSDIQYINAHGSGTILNDRLETQIIKNIFRDHTRNLIINSSKSIIGHTLGAAGLIEAIITIVSLNTGCIHPTANFIEPDPECDLNYSTMGISSGEFSIALSNSFGFGGINVSIIFAKGDYYEN